VGSVVDGVTDGGSPARSLAAGAALTSAPALVWEVREKTFER
jgi:hypothetical protein